MGSADTLLHWQQASGGLRTSAAKRWHFSTVARSLRGLSANLTTKFRNLAKNSAIFLAFRSYVIKSHFGNEKWFCLHYLG
jgi:hypothetical protein